MKGKSLSLVSVVTNGYLGVMLKLRVSICCVEAPFKSSINSVCSRGAFRVPIFSQPILIEGCIIECDKSLKLYSVQR